MDIEFEDWDDSEDTWDNIDDIWDSIVLPVDAFPNLAFIKKFNNETISGSEKALKRGMVVPPNAVNLAWIESPTLSPGTNMVVVDTSLVTPNNIETPKPSVYYGNLLGKLEDGQGNQLLTEQYPAIGDEFSIEGDITNVDLSIEHIFPYAHISRYFHVDKAGI